jgi:VCBS repeat-containing protein
MKNILSASLVLTAIGFVAVAHAACECGSLKVSTSRGQYDFALEQENGGMDVTSSDKKLTIIMARYNNQNVCLNITGTRDAYGDEGAEVTGFCRQ